MAYPLQPLLNVRSFRETNAQAAVSAAESRVREAEAVVAEREAELARYREWWPQEVERRYAAIMGESMSLTDLDKFKAGLAALADGEYAREAAVQEAEKVVDERKAELQAARDALLAARKDKMKIDAHKDIWSQAEAKEAERAADIELEDFVPKTALGDPGQEEDS